MELGGSESIKCRVIQHKVIKMSDESPPLMMSLKTQGPSQLSLLSPLTLSAPDTDRAPFQKTQSCCCSYREPAGA